MSVTHLLVNLQGKIGLRPLATFSRAFSAKCEAVARLDSVPILVGGRVSRVGSFGSPTLNYI